MSTLIETTSNKLVKAFLKNKIIAPLTRRFTKIKKTEVYPEIIRVEITIKEGLGDKIANIIRSLLGKLGINIRFRTGKDVFNFV